VLAAISKRMERDAHKDMAEFAKEFGINPAHYARAMRYVGKAARQPGEVQ
jgi:hypothetical protein